MTAFITFILVVAGGTIGYAFGFITRMRRDPSLQGKGLKEAMFKKK